MGAITWAMRGSSGWGGFDGTLIPGMTWAILWNYFAYLRGLDGRISGFWLGIGVSIGGMWGYGQYVSWIQGIFYTNTNVIPYESILVNPIYGYIWFWIVGAIWLGIAGVFLGWALDKNYFNLSRSEKIKKWLPRIEIPLMTALIGWILTILYPQWFFPNYSEVLYTEIACPDCFERTISTNTINFIMLMWWIGAIIVAYIQKDKYTFRYAIFLGVSFGFLYMLSAMWMLMDTLFPGYIDWWKIWEMMAGFSGGILYGILQYYILRDIERISKSTNLFDHRTKTLIQDHIFERRANIFLTLIIATLLVVIIYGGSFKIGVLLHLYDGNIDQYSFPLPRILIFVPFTASFIVWMIIQIFKIMQKSHAENYFEFKITHIHKKLIYILLYITLIGVAVSWGTKIEFFYILFFILNLIILVKLNKSRKNELFTN